MRNDTVPHLRLFLHADMQAFLCGVLCVLCMYAEDQTTCVNKSSSA